MRTKVYAKRRGTRIKTPNGWDSQYNRNREEGNTIFHFALPAEYNRGCDYRAQGHHPIDRKQRKGERFCTPGTFDDGIYRVGIDLHCGWSLLAIVGELVLLGVGSGDDPIEKSPAPALSRLK